MKVVFLFLCIFLLSCSDKHTRYDSERQIYASINKNSSIIDSTTKTYRETLSSKDKLKENIEIDFKAIKYSSPDSSGKQHVIKEVSGTARKNTEKDKEKKQEIETSESDILKSDSTFDNVSIQKENETFASEKKAIGLNRIIWPLIIISVLSFLFYYFVKKTNG